MALVVNKVCTSTKYMFTVLTIDANCVLEATVIDAKTVKPKADASSPKKRHGLAASVETIGVETLTYRDPFAGVYKKCVLLHNPASTY